MKSKSIDNLRKTLFWDVDPDKLDLEKNAQFIIGRVLDFGGIEDWKAIKNFYGLKKIKEAALGHVFSDRRSPNFWSIILKIPLKDLKCTRNPSLKIPCAFLRR